jgi:hypothetical protein
MPVQPVIKINKAIGKQLAALAPQIINNLIYDINQAAGVSVYGG